VLKVRGNEFLKGHGHYFSVDFNKINGKVSWHLASLENSKRNFIGFLSSCKQAFSKSLIPPSEFHCKPLIKKITFS